jgi:hypothetical protein
MADPEGWIRNISAYADNELDVNERQSFEEHIKNCPSCKEELDDMLRIIRICNNMPQQELPAGFKSELHEKLTAVSVRQGNIHVVQEKPKKIIFTRTFASIAAGILLIFLTGSIIRFGLFSRNYSTKSADSYEMAAQTPSEAPAAAAAGEGAAYSLNDVQDTTGKQSAEPEANYEGGSAEMDYGIMASEKPMEAPAKGFAVDRSEAMEARDDGSFAKTVIEAVSSKNSTITILAKDTANATEILTTLASQNNGTVKAGDGVDNGLQDSPETAAVSVPQDEVQSQLQLQYAFAEADYNAFVAALDETFGAADVQTGAFVSEDMTDAMNMLIDQSVQYDAEMQKLQQDNSVKNSEEINKLKKEKENIDGQIEKIRLNSDFVTVTVYVNPK